MSLSDRLLGKKAVEERRTEEVVKCALDFYDPLAETAQRVLIARFGGLVWTLLSDPKRGLPAGEVEEQFVDVFREALLNAVPPHKYAVGLLGAVEAALDREQPTSWAGFFFRRYFAFEADYKHAQRIVAVDDALLSTPRKPGELPASYQQRVVLEAARLLGLPDSQDKSVSGINKHCKKVASMVGRSSLKVRTAVLRIGVTHVAAQTGHRYQLNELFPI